MTLLEHFNNGTIEELFRKGVISINHMTYFRYYKVFKAYKEKGNSKNHSYELAADECGCSKDTIMRAVKVLTKQ